MSASHDDRLADLNERISRLEQKAKPDVVAPEPPQSTRRSLSAADRRFRRVNGWAIAVACILVCALGAVQNWGEVSPLEMILGIWPFILAAAGVYGINLFYWELGKRAARRFRRRKEPPFE